MRKTLLALTALGLSGCTTMGDTGASAPVDIRIIGINDFHGHLDPPKQVVEKTQADGSKLRIPAGGAAYLASAVDALKSDAPNHVVVAAGDLIGGTPLSSSLFLDEPAILAMNMIGVEFNAAGNHEFDRGTDELLRMQNGGCEKHTTAEPCRVDTPFPGAQFRILTANTFKEGKTLLPAYGLKDFGSGKAKVTVGFIGMTLEGTANLVSASRIKGVQFADEADTANALVPKLKAAGADVIIVLIHEGVTNPGDFNNPRCEGLTGALIPILDRLDPAIDVVVSGHTHQGGRLLSKSARNIVVQSEAFTGARGAVPLVDAYPKFAPRADVAALVARYRDAAKADESRVIGSLSGPATRDGGKNGESLLGNLIADAQLAATAVPENGGAQIAFMNPGGLRADVVPGADGKVTFGSIFAAQPFGNILVTKTMTGQQIRALLEQQFNDANWLRILSPSNGFRFGYDLSKPVGQRVVFATLNGQPLADATSYRVTVSDFLSNGGDAFTLFKDGSDAMVGPTDIEALTAWLVTGRALPAIGRVERINGN
ncbi:MAG: bifunctional metallophosphatase/5'-nucleotidase [Sphingomonadales bacterium]|nr:bifunctional metallophosphatase/5'-nucleotidase [Sphingomonadales bacterium]